MVNIACFATQKHRRTRKAATIAIDASAYDKICTLLHLRCSASFFLEIPSVRQKLAPNYFSDVLLTKATCSEGGYAELTQMRQCSKGAVNKDAHDKRLKIKCNYTSFHHRSVHTQRLEHTQKHEHRCQIGLAVTTAKATNAVTRHLLRFSIDPTRL